MTCCAALPSQRDVRRYRGAEAHSQLSQETPVEPQPTSKPVFSTIRPSFRHPRSGMRASQPPIFSCGHCLSSFCVLSFWSPIQAMHPLMIKSRCQFIAEPFAIPFLKGGERHIKSSMIEPLNKRRLARAADKHIHGQC